MTDTVTPESVPIDDARALRRSVLRPGLDPEASVYPGDLDPATLHTGVRDANGWAAVGSIFRQAPPHSSEPDAWRIRGMVTVPDARGRGHGAAVLRACLEHARSQGGTMVWCNARVGAAGFYAKHGFTREGDEFDLPGIGPHYRMVARLA